MRCSNLKMCILCLTCRDAPNPLQTCFHSHHVCSAQESPQDNAFCAACFQTPFFAYSERSLDFLLTSHRVQGVATHLYLRVGQNRIYTYIFTVNLVISKPKLPHVHRIYIYIYIYGSGKPYVFVSFYFPFIGNDRHAKVDRHDQRIW
jgi:hypothetical protein